MQNRTWAAIPSRSILFSGVSGVYAIGKRPRNGFAVAPGSRLEDSANPAAPNSIPRRNSRLPKEDAEFVVRNPVLCGRSNLRGSLYPAFHRVNRRDHSCVPGHTRPCSTNETTAKKVTLAIDFEEP